MLTELSSGKQEELLREAVSRQTPLTLSCRLPSGWSTFASHFLGLDRASGDLVVISPSGPEHLGAEVVEGHSIGVAFRRGSHKCVFETQLTGRCFFSTGRADDVPSLRLLWPTSMFELQRRLYYRTPVPEDIHLPVEAWLWGTSPDDATYGQTLRGSMLDLSAGGVSFSLPKEDNPRWAVNTAVGCSFQVPNGDKLQLFGHARYASPTPSTEIRLGIQFLGLETPETARSALEQVVRLTSEFQKIEMKRVARV